MPLDFKRGTDLFLGHKDELAMALGIEADALEAFRRQPTTVPDELLGRLAAVLVERGRGMIRVGELLAGSGGGSSGNGRHD
ncbi:MAG: hypothetical protein P8Z36_02340 [Gemmatimonadota bacterium]|jgi:hypothetical protein